MMTCSECRRLVTRFLGLDLSSEDERGVRGHLASCPACAGHLGEREPASALALAVSGEGAGETDERFVADVMAGIRMRRVERRRPRQGRGWLAAAAALVLAASAGVLTLRDVVAPPSTTVAERPEGAASPAPPTVEVEGEGVRLYQMESGSVQVAFIVDPSLEL